MCGIIGYQTKGQWKPEADALERAVDALEHRGPDHRGVWTGEKVALGFRRLSIIDLATGDQPMTNEDGSLLLVCNGEIYNFQELRAHLESRGHRFKTRSDVEVILHLYEEESEGCVKLLRGMFAFAIYDEKQRGLFLARDRFGKKPLVYTETATGFYFASEIGALLQIADTRRIADRRAIDAYLALRYVPSPYTAWRGIRRLSPASTLWVQSGHVETPHRYWRLEWFRSPSRPMSNAEAAERFRERFEESVRMRLVADVPVGAFLSGGVDSSVTVAAMSRLGGRVKTFCIGFDDPRFDESAYAREVAQRLGTEHHELIVQPDSLDALDPLIENLGEPFADQSLLPTYAISHFTRQYVTVALSGDGGDELFAGYKRYRHLALAHFLESWGLSRPWLAASRMIFGIEQLFNPSRRKLQWPRSAVDQILGKEFGDQYLHLVGCWGPKKRATLWKRPIESDLVEPFMRGVQNCHVGVGRLSLSQAFDVETYLSEDILRKVDLASMACSLECRCPLLDHRVAELASKLPLSLRVDWTGANKVLLKQLYPDILPPAFFEREKKGFSMPIGRWMRKQWWDPVHTAIEGQWSGNLESVFDRRALRQLWEEHQEGRQDHGERLWAWLVLHRWNERFKPEWD
jgi:asparagine synthase (glutamine-hydrolysing)